MTRIKKHTYSKWENIPIYKSKDHQEVIANLKYREWMGILDEDTDSFLVMTINAVGWVLKSDCLLNDPTGYPRMMIIDGIPHYFSSIER